jgi:probable selenate reductase molybdenum-binding subunit
MSNEWRVIGTNVDKVDGIGLATGRAAFTDDEEYSGLLHAKMLYSPYPHARIRNIDTSGAERLDGVHTVLCHKNVPRIFHTTAGQGYPEPSPWDTLLFDRKVRFVGDRVAAIAADTADIAREAARLIHIEYEELPAVFDAEEAISGKAPVIHDETEARYPFDAPYDPKRNMAACVEATIGDAEKGLKEGDWLVDRTYETQYASHCMLEPHIVICHLDSQNRLVIRTSTQVPFHVRRIVAQSLNFPLRRIRVIKPRTGGAFGGKQEVFLEQVCALLCLRTQRPVRLALTREEVFISSRGRHPQRIRLRSGLKKDGSITALDLDVLMNTGAYGSHALTVVCNSGSKVLPLLNRVPHVTFRGRTAYTNLPVGGAYRGYGVTQAMFALGVHMDEMAEIAGVDVVDFWKRHHIRSGETSPIFEALGEGRSGVETVIESCGLEECIDAGVREIGWSRKRGKKIRSNHSVRGVGMTCLMQGSSIPDIDMGAAVVKMNEDGSFNLMVGATDLGTGSDTVLSQIAAETLGTDIDDIIIYSSDTDLTPFDVGAYASSTTYLSGMAVKKAATDAMAKIIAVASEMLECDAADLTSGKRSIVAKDGTSSASFEEIANYSLYSRNQFQIIGHASHISKQSPPPFSAHFVEVAVDPETGFVEVLQYIAAVDCGTAIHPRLAEGQTEGGVLNGISFALTEEYLFDRMGRMRNPSFSCYKIFSTGDLPEIRTILVPTYEPTGPYGAKSVSEICINGALPAISNAIYDAAGIRMRNSPFTPEKVWRAIHEGKKQIG